MSDYIERVEAQKQFCLDCKHHEHPCDHKNTCQTLRVLKKVQSADVAPVRHGRWIFNGEDMSLTCSDCGVKYNIDDADGGLDSMENAKYCISCGTRMDEVEDDDV